MTPVGLRLRLTPDVLSKLVTAVVYKFRNFVRISRIEHAGAFYEVDLRILGAYDAKEPKAGEGIHPTESVIVTREMVGELFNLLGLFPPRVSSHDTNDFLLSVAGAADEIHQEVAGWNSGLIPNGGIELVLTRTQKVRTAAIEYQRKLKGETSSVSS